MNGILKESAEVKPPKDKRQLTSLHAPVPANPGFFLNVAARRLISVPATALLLNRSRRDVLALIEEGRLRWAFDIRTASAGRGELRVLGQSILEFSGIAPVAATRIADETGEFSRIINLILPPGAAMKSSPQMALARLPAAGELILRGTEVGQCLGCNCGHVHNLILDGLLQIVNLRRAVKSTPLILRASVENFLKDRRSL